MTKNELRRIANAMNAPIVRVGHCDAQALTGAGREIGHAHGIYGWNWTAYNCGGAIICTGYRDLIGTRHDATVRQTEQTLENLLRNDYATFCATKDAILKAFADEIKAEVVSI